ncbi:MAG: PEP-CTERM sorting domain-containing protein [Phycisphaeraceae bacterium]|nr:PEP-CTERM sorting domain-containing protein [Phycisphaeraceae bacterium]
MNCKLVLGVLSLVLGGALAQAEIVKIDFEDLAASTSVTNQYAHLGVHFSMTPIVDPSGTYHSAVEVFSYAKGDFGTKAAGLWASPVLITFDSAVSNFSVLMSDTERGSLLGSVRAYDANGKLIDYVTDMTGNYNTSWFYQNTLRIQAGGIRSVVLMSDADGAIFDNITFTRIPSPGAMALLPFGLLGLARRRRD